MIFIASILAETNRHPFDLPEDEATLVTGYNVEYSSMAFALFFLGEYANMILMSGITSVLFLGGWLPPFNVFPFTLIPGPIWFILKICFVLFIFFWARATLPRYRYDQLMRLGWKVFLPLSLLWVVLTAGFLVAFDLLPTLRRLRHGHPRPHGADAALAGAGDRLRHDLEVHVQEEGDAELPLREGPAQPALSRRARAAALSQRRGALHRLQAVRGGLPGAVHRDRERAARRRQPAHHALRHRHDQVHLLRLLRGGLPGRRHRHGARTTSSPPRRARSCSTTRRSCSRTATAGSSRSPPTSRRMRPTGEHARLRLAAGSSTNRGRHP